MLLLYMLLMLLLCEALMHSLIHSLLSSYLQAHPKIAIFILSLWTVYSGPTPTLSILNKGYEQQVHVLPQKQKYSVPSEN